MNQTHRQAVRRWICFLGLLLCLAAPRAVRAGCDIQIVSAGPCLLDATYGIPHVGDKAYAVKVVINVLGAPTHPFRFRWTLANVTNYSDYYSLTNWYGASWWLVIPMSLDDPIPWSVSFDPDGVSGDINMANNVAGGSFTPIPPAHAVELFGTRAMHGYTYSKLSFQPGSGTIGTLWELFSIPSTHGTQVALRDTGPAGAVTILTPPYGIPLFELARTNVAAATFLHTNSFTAQLSNMRVNPGLLRQITWADLNSMTADWTQWLAPDPYCQSADPLILNFVQQALPANYRLTLSPYDTARTLHRAVMKAFHYQTPPLHEDAVGCLRDGFADCGGFAVLLAATLRNVGIPARRICGFREGDSVWHARTEFHLPGQEWIVADPTDGNAVDPTGTFAYYFGCVDDADSFLAGDVGDSHQFPFFESGGINASGFYWTGGATFLSYDCGASLQPNGVLRLTNSPKGSLQFFMDDVPATGSVLLQLSTNLASWTTIRTNPANGSIVNYSFPTTAALPQFYRATVVP